MPKVNISEIDTTTSGSLDSNDYIVLIPGKATSGSLLEDGYDKVFATVGEFEKVVGTNNSDPGNKMARYLLGLGMLVRYVIESDLAVLDSYNSFWEKYEDKGLYNIRFLTTGDRRTKLAAENAIKCAAERGDAIALIDVEEPSESGEEYNEDYVNTWINSLEVDAITRVDGVKENPFKYATSFTRDIAFKGEADAKFPGSFAYLACFAAHTARFPDWFAMAGSIRGVIPFEEVTTDYKFGDAAINKLQARTVEVGTTFKATNVIANIRPYGNIIWGNRTLYPIGIANDSGVVQYGLTASSFLNIRNLCCDIKKTLYRAAKRFTFEPNSNVLWFNFTSAIKPLLEQMREGQGIKGYQIIKETTDEKAVLKAKIRIVPIEAVEDFELTVELTDSIVVTE